MTEERDKLDIEVALKNREFELSLFWQRSNYFLVLNTALGVAAFSARTALVGAMITAFGILVCWLWYRTNLGSRFWHVFWESEVERLAPKYELKSFEFSTAEIKAIVRRNVQPESSPWWRGWIDKGVLEKPSVTIHMIYLSLAALLFWLLILFYHVHALTIGQIDQQPSPLASTAASTQTTTATPPVRVRAPQP